MLKVDMIWLGITAAVALFVLAMALPAYGHSIHVGGWHYHPHPSEDCDDPELKPVMNDLDCVDSLHLDDDAPQEAAAILLTAAVMALLVRAIDRKAGEKAGSYIPDND